MEQVRRRGNLRGVGDATVIEVRASIHDRPARIRSASAESRGHQEVKHSRQLLGDLRARQLFECGRERPRVQRGEVTAAAEHGDAGGDRPIRLVLSVDQRGQLRGERSLRLPLPRSLGDCPLELLDLRARSEAEDLEQGHDVRIVLVDEVLVEGEGRRHLRIQEDRTGLRLAVLLPVGARDQWGRQRVHRCSLDAPDEVCAGGQVAPLVRAAGLQDAAVATEQLEKVHRLQNLVAELGEADASGLETSTDRFLPEHARHAEVLADIAQEVEGRHRSGPVQVVHDARRVGLLEREDMLHLAPDPLDPARDHVDLVE